jgi:hypothetical protein
MSVPKGFPFEPRPSLLALGLPERALSDGVGSVYKQPPLRAEIFQRHFGTARNRKRSVAVLRNA